MVETLILRPIEDLGRHLLLGSRLPTQVLESHPPHYSIKDDNLLIFVTKTSNVLVYW